jgi:hypothetical protein
LKKTAACSVSVIVSKFKKFQLGKSQIEALDGIKTFISPKPLARKWQRWKM